MTHKKIFINANLIELKKNKCKSYYHIQNSLKLSKNNPNNNNNNTKTIH